MIALSPARSSAARGLESALKASLLKEKSEAVACLLPFLQALHWHGNSRDVLEALPHFSDDLSLLDLRNTLARVGIRTVGRELGEGGIDPRLLPCLLATPDGGVRVILKIKGETAEVFNGATGAREQVPLISLAGTAFVVVPSEKTEERTEPKAGSWLKSTLLRFGKSCGRLLAMTLGLNVLALSVPLFIMVVYDQVVPAQSGRLLLPLFFGLVLALGLELVLRVARARSLAFIGGRLEHLVSTAVLGKLLALPSSMTDSAPIGTQLARLKEFDSIREFFSGSMAGLLLELPFVLLFIGVIALIGGPLALVPLSLLVGLLLVGGLLLPRLKQSSEQAASTGAARHGFLMEAVNRLRDVMEARAEKEWRERHRELSAVTALAQRKSRASGALLEALGQAAMMLAGVITIAMGANMVMDGSLTVGALIAVMALTWRVLSPINSLFLTATRVGAVSGAARQINRLMSMEGEQVMGPASEIERSWRGDINFSRVTLRYQVEAEPALLGVSFAVKPGEFIAITGSNGSGKSSILRLVLGLYRPQAGQVSVDGQDIRQMVPADLRHAIAYVPQHSHFFHGTIAQNLRLANPMATEEELVQACHAANILPDVVSLPDGFETRIGDQNIWQFNAGFRQRLALARAYVKRAPILLLDEPAHALDDRADQALTDTLQRMKGQSTIMMISHRPSHIRLADRVLVLDKGVLVADGKPDEIMKKRPGGGQTS